MTAHEKYREMKKALGLTNADIAGVTGLTTNSVKNQTQTSKDLPAWARGMIYIWEKLK